MKEIAISLQFVRPSVLLSVFRIDLMNTRDKAWHVFGVEAVFSMELLIHCAMITKWHILYAYRVRSTATVRLVSRFAASLRYGKTVTFIFVIFCCVVCNCESCQLLLAMDWWDGVHISAGSLEMLFFFLSFRIYDLKNEIHSVGSPSCTRYTAVKMTWKCYGRTFFCVRLNLAFPILCEWT